MASFYLSKSTLSLISISQPNFPGKSDSRKTLLKFKSLTAFRPGRYILKPIFRVSCSAKDGESQSNGEEPPESLFMKELKRRGMTPTSLLEETSRDSYGVEDEINIGEEDRDFLKRKAVSTELDKGISNQRERSMALNSEGLEGLIPRAKLLLTLGGTFFLGFWPLILITVAFFCGLYFYFGPSFVHDASNTPVSPPQYVDPYALLEDERISQIAPSLK